MTYGKTARGASSPATEDTMSRKAHRSHSLGTLTAGLAHARTIVDHLYM